MWPFRRKNLSNQHVSDPLDAQTIDAINNAMCAGGNFGYIAQNIAAIYHAIELTPFGQKLTEDQHLFATGLLDTVAYIAEGSIEEDDIMTAVKLASVKTVSSFPHQIRHGGLLDNDGPNSKLICFAMQIEALIFVAENLTDSETVLNEVVHHKSQIAEMIDKTIKEGAQCRIFSSIMPQTAAATCSPEFQQLVLSYR